jgi:hypothetical protein
MTLHLEPSEIERRCRENLAMYEGAKWPSETTRNLAQHWRENLESIQAYQMGRIDLAGLPLAVRELGWKMPDWGTYGT